MVETKKILSFSLIITWFYVLSKQISFSNNLNNSTKEKIERIDLPKENVDSFFDKLIKQKNHMISFMLNDSEVVKKYPFRKVKCNGLVAVDDFDISIQMQDTGMIDWICATGRHKSSEELKVSKVMLHIFQMYNSSLMLDIGANSGYYGLLAARYGHKVVQFDLQPECLKILRNSVLENNFQKTVMTLGTGISDSNTDVDVPENGCNGQFPRRDTSVGSAKVKMPLHPLVEVLNLNKTSENIMMMKIDTEGNEKRVLSGALEFFRQKRISNAIVEVTPCCDFWKNAGIQQKEVVDIFGKIVSYGYVMVSLYDNKIFKAKEDVMAYLSSPPFTQSDMFLTLEPDIKNITGHFLPTLSSSDPNFHSWYSYL